MYNSPIFAAHLVEVQRGLQQALNNAKSLYAQYPEDFELYELGTFNPETGELKVRDNALYVMTLSELLDKEAVCQKED